MTLSVERETRGVRWVLKMSDIGEGQGCPLCKEGVLAPSRTLSSRPGGACGSFLMIVLFLFLQYNLLFSKNFLKSGFPRALILSSGLEGVVPPTERVASPF
jgi:hypothetical protein